MTTADGDLDPLVAWIALAVGFIVFLVSTHGQIGSLCP